MQLRAIADAGEYELDALYRRGLLELLQAERNRARQAAMRERYASGASCPVTCRTVRAILYMAELVQRLATEQSTLAARDLASGAS